MAPSPDGIVVVTIPYHELVPSFYLNIIFRIKLYASVMTVCTLVFLWSWNNYMLPLITLNKEETYTLPLLISNIGVAYMHDYGAQMLALALSTFPILVIFSFGSKYFIQGITAGAVKG